jgi:hypothetical protein
MAYKNDKGNLFCKTLTCTRYNGPPVPTSGFTSTTNGWKWAKAGNTSAQSIANNTFTTPTLPTTSGQTFGTIADSGMYLLTIYAVWSANATGRRSIHVINTRVGVLHAVTENTNSAAGTTILSGTFFLPWIAGDTITPIVYQNSGGALNLDFVSCDWVRLGDL